MSEIVAIIPARAGSKTLKNKNIELLSGHPLIAYSIAAAKLSKQIDRIIVSTDSEYYAEIALKYGAEVPFIRPKELASDESLDRDFLIHAMQWFNKNEICLPEYWVHLRPTTPLRSPQVIDDAISLIKSKYNSSSLRSGHKAPESPLKWFSMDQYGYFKGLINSEVEKKEFYNLPKEFFDDVYIPDGYVDVLKASHIMKSKSTHGNHMIGFESPVCIEIDSIEEFEYIQFAIHKKGSLLLEYLNKLNIGRV
jgi:CMP-N,N'-diacetyllegionaminic acid synthase